MQVQWALLQTGQCRRGPQAQGVLLQKRHAPPAAGAEAAAAAAPPPPPPPTAASLGALRGERGCCCWGTGWTGGAAGDAGGAAPSPPPPPCCPGAGGCGASHSTSSCLPMPTPAAQRLSMGCNGAPSPLTHLRRTDEMCAPALGGMTLSNTRSTRSATSVRPDSETLINCPPAPHFTHTKAAVGGSGGG